MPSFDDFIVFVDESGDHGLETADPNYPIFVLAFCLFRKDNYARTAVPALIDLKFKHFGHDQVILHEREIRKREGDFQVLNDPQVRTEFHADLDSLIEQTPFTLVASVIDKESLKSSYLTPGNPYHLAMAFGLERIYLHLQQSTPGTVWFVFERRGKKEDDDLELQFRRYCETNATGQTLPFKIRFASKATNSCGLQIADLIARPIGRHHLKPTQPNRAHEVIEQKFRRGPGGRLMGWGLKVFP
ncbi:MAG: DUF3800 domain-containing protein [Candidatus Krumholzibacteriia bacterium]